VSVAPQSARQVEKEGAGEQEKSVINLLLRDEFDSTAPNCQILVANSGCWTRQTSSE
jgi:hypothetical protein